MSDLIGDRMRRCAGLSRISRGLRVCPGSMTGIVSGIILVIRNGLPWRDAPHKYGPYKTISSRFIRLELPRRIQPDIRAELAAVTASPIN